MSVDLSRLMYRTFQLMIVVADTEWKFIHTRLIFILWQRLRCRRILRIEQAPKNIWFILSTDWSPKNYTVMQWRRFLLEICGTSAEGASVERRRRDDRGAEGAEGGRVWGGGASLPTAGEVWGGGCAPYP